MTFQTVLVATLAVVLGSASAGQAMLQDEPPTKPTCIDSSAQCQHDKEDYRLKSMIYGCKETKKQKDGLTFSICVSKGKVVSAEEWITDVGDGIGYFFDNGKVVAIRYFHDNNLAIFTNGKLVRMYEEENAGTPTSNKKIKTKFTKAERRNIEATATRGFRSVLKKFGR